MTLLADEGVDRQIVDRLRALAATFSTLPSQLQQPRMTRLWTGPIGDVRHSFVTHLLEDDSDIRTVQKLLSCRDVSTTTICTHVLN